MERFGVEEVSAVVRWMKERLCQLVAQGASADGQWIDRLYLLGKGQVVGEKPLLLPAGLVVVRIAAAGSCRWATGHLVHV